MATTDSDLTAGTSYLAQFKRQFYQWKYIEKKSFPQVKQAFDELFGDLTKETDFRLKASQRQWQSWDKKWKLEWDTASDGLSDTLLGFPLWRQWGKQVTTFHAKKQEDCER
ncbi:MAG: hypothetical protein Q9201_001501 [Fulgogasparrea decipioides]